MSFSSEAKIELCKIAPQDFCCKKAECYGLLLFARNFSPAAVGTLTENGSVARRMAELCAELTGTIVDTTAAFHRKGEKSSYTVSVGGADQRVRVLGTFGHTGKEISLRINRANLENECCTAAFLRGVFLTCGTVTDPKKDYHLEFIVAHMNLAKDLTALLSETESLNLQPAIVNRKGSYVVYIKGSERITDLLAYIGAGNSAMELIQVKMLKEVRNNVNRKTNFETANIDKTVDAAVRQVEAIEKLKGTIGLDNLPQELRELAELRLENPEMSLRELGQSLSEPISRSGVNHRLQRLLEMGKE